MRNIIASLSENKLSQFNNKIDVVASMLTLHIVAKLVYNYFDIYKVSVMTLVLHVSDNSDILEWWKTAF